MYKIGTWRVVAVLAAALLTANVASAELLIDDFSAPGTNAVTIIGLVSPDPTLIKTPSGAVLGGERDLLLDVAGTPAPISYSGTIGQGAFVFGSAASNPGTIATLQYDGFDPDSVGPPASLVNGESLGGIDLTAFGTAFILDFDRIDGGLRTETDLAIEVHGTAGVASYAGFIGDSGVAVTHSVAFTDFSGDDVFSDVSSITLVLNGSATADVDFAMTKVAVPEPTTMAFLAAGGLGLLARRKRRKARI